MRPFATCLALASLAVGTPAMAQGAQALIAEARADIAKACDGRIEFRRGFQTEADVNGDGRPDYLLDYRATKCIEGSGATNGFCGSAGCVLDILVSGEGGYRNGWSDNVRGWSLARSGGKSVLVVGVHGSACGKSGAEPCEKRFVWSRDTFVPLP